MDLLTKGRTDHSQNTFNGNEAPKQSNCNGNEALKQNNPCPTKTHYTSRPHDTTDLNTITRTKQKSAKKGTKILSK
jgi:hypothetical protein